MTYLKYELTPEEFEKLLHIHENEPMVGNNGWDCQNGRSNAASYSMNILGQNTISGWTEQMLDDELSKVIKKTAFNIIKRIPFEIKKKLFLEYKSSHHTSRPTDSQDWYDTSEDLVGVSIYLKAHILSVKEARKLYQASRDVENGIIELNNAYSFGSEPVFLNFIG